VQRGVTPPLPSVLSDFLYEDAESTRGFRVAAFLAPVSLAAIFVFFYRLSFLLLPEMIFMHTNLSFWDLEGTSSFVLKSIKWEG